MRTWLGRTCPPASVAPPDEAGLPQEEEPSAGTAAARPRARARGRFTRNFVVQGSAADWALLVLAALRRALSPGGLRAELVFFQHDEVIVHCPAGGGADGRRGDHGGGRDGGRIAFGETPVRFPFTTAVVECYADAK